MCPYISALTSFLNNRFQLHLKKMELQESAENELFSKKLETYEGALRTIGNCIAFVRGDLQVVVFFFDDRCKCNPSRIVITIAVIIN